MTDTKTQPEALRLADMIEESDCPSYVDAAAAELRRQHAALAERLRPLSEYHEDMGAVVWWRVEPGDAEPLGEPAWIGRPDDPGWDLSSGIGGAYYTHFTPHPRRPSLAAPSVPAPCVPVAPEPDNFYDWVVQQAEQASRDIASWPKWMREGIDWASATFPSAAAPQSGETPTTGEAG